MNRPKRTIENRQTMAKELVMTNNSKPSHEEIARRARELYERSGRRPGRDLENWLEAERELISARKAVAAPKNPAKPVAKPELRT